MNRDVSWRWLTATVWTHLVVSLVHGVAHNGAHVLLSPLQTGFVFLVILAGPLIGLAVARWRSRAGAWIMAVTLGASLVFGVVNHFVVAGPDHVTHVAQAWRPLFAWTAALVGLTEAIGSGLAISART